MSQIVEQDNRKMLYILAIWLYGVQMSVGNWCYYFAESKMQAVQWLNFHVRHRIQEYGIY